MRGIDVMSVPILPWTRDGALIFSTTLPGLPPTVNHLYRTSMHGVRYKTAGGKAWQTRTALALREARGGVPTYLGEVAVVILFVTPDKKRWDIDNRLKALLDCLQSSGALKDDRQIALLHVERAFRRAGEAETDIALWALARS
ncbi:MAG: RusA family crossover junction endodeoxyribonuclease [Synergistaceae bacterium]|nr:RusA family crossover junction endodeoxyribonuclease [Synergistaceae bacterium]